MKGLDLIGCLGKVRFESARLASEIAKARHVHGRREAYRCDSCGGWHLGQAARHIHKNRKKRQYMAQEAE